MYVVLYYLLVVVLLHTCEILINTGVLWYWLGVPLLQVLLRVVLY